MSGEQFYKGILSGEGNCPGAIVRTPCIKRCCSVFPDSHVAQDGYRKVVLYHTEVLNSKRSGITKEAMNARLIIAENGETEGTALFFDTDGLYRIFCSKRNVYRNHFPKLQLCKGKDRHAIGICVYVTFIFYRNHQTVADRSWFRQTVLSDCYDIDS